MADAYYRSSHTGEEIDQAIDNYNDLKNAAETATQQAGIAMLAAQQAEESSVSADYKKTLGFVTVTLLAGSTHWQQQSGTNYFLQSVNVQGMTESWVPGIPSIYIDSSQTLDFDSMEQMLDAFANVKAIFSFQESLTFVAVGGVPTVDLVVRVPGMEAKA